MREIKGRKKRRKKKKRTAASCLPGRTEGSWWRCSLQHGPKILGIVVAVVVVLFVADRRRVSEREREREKGRVRGCKRERKGRKTRQKTKSTARVAYQQRPRVRLGGVVSGCNRVVAVCRRQKSARV